MINTSLSEIAFNCEESEMDSAVRSALRKTALGLLEWQNLTEEHLAKVSTKTSPELLYSKFVLQTILTNTAAVFDKAFVINAYDLYQNRHREDAKTLLYRFLLTDESKVEFRTSYGRWLTRGIGPFFVALHSTGLVTLPMGFHWPRPGGKSMDGAIDVGKPFSPEIVAFVRSLESQSTDIPDPAFRAVGKTKKRREWFSCYGTRLIIATGWQTVGDANVDDLVKLSAAVNSNGTSKNVTYPFTLLVDVLWRKYGARIAITPESYDRALKASGLVARVSRLGLKSANENTSQLATLSSIMYHEASDAYPKVLRARDAVPGLSVDLGVLSGSWLDIEEAYLKNLRRENKRQTEKAIGWLNVYLFLYLPYWFAAHPESTIEFPDCPQKLTSGVFVTRLIDLGLPAPETFMAMMDKLRDTRRWVGNSYYSLVKQVELFFAFIERKADSLPGSSGFRQPLTQDDFPASTSRKNTDKRPIEKRLFGVTLDLTEALIAYSEAIIDRILCGLLHSRDFQIEISRFGPIIDTFQVAHLTGVIPVLFFRGKTIPLRIIPNVLSFTAGLKLKGFEDGVEIPSPHALNQIYVALHTGIRHNHIQWLDERSFDKWAIDNESLFTQLHVNTDKRKRDAWKPYVAACVIDRLRAQRRWRNLFDEPQFLNEHFYNGNPDTKWEPILPLFSFAKSGMPHSDSVYTRVWGRLLCALQGLLPELGEESFLPFKSHGKLVPRIGMLEPSYVKYNDPNAEESRKVAGAKEYQGKQEVPLEFKSPMTPHSSRVSVVQQYMTYLPADLIGKYFTGQTARTVHYYHIPDPAELARQGVHQAMSIKARANQEWERLSEFRTPETRAVYADDVNASLSRSLRENLDATIEAHGCVSLALANSELSGIEVLQRTMAVDAVLNKTEICPYGNRCPSDVIKLLGKSNRCGLCPYAVRSVDHLPAVSAKLKQQNDELAALQSKIADANRVVPSSLTDAEFEQMDKLCCDLSEDVTGWQLSEEVLYHTLQKLKAGKDTSRWVVQMPEAVARDLRRVNVPSNVTAYTLARLSECIAFPALDSPQIRARFDLMRRQLLAKSGRVTEALASRIPSNPAVECAGLLKTIVESHHIGFNELVEALESDSHLASLPHHDTPLLTGGD